jgi:folate-binding protein YgfZ
MSILKAMNFSTFAAFHGWRPAAWLRVTGEDAATFLQGQFTNELRGLPAGGAVYGLWLTLKGKVLADSFVVRGAEPAEFWVGSYFSAAAVIRERLEAFIIADDVVVEDVTAEWAGVTLLGEGVAAAMAAAAATAGGARGGVVFRGRRGKEEAVEWVFPVAESAAVQAQIAGGRELEGEEMARRRIAAGVPAVPVDIGPGDLPGEGGLEHDAISYTKGCYLGQEVMARLKSMGQVRRRLMRVAVRAGGAAPGSLPAALFAGGRKVGEVRSAVSDGAGGWVGLAMLSLLQLEAEVGLALAVDAAPTVRLVDGP